MEVRQNLIKLCEKINDGHYKITPDCAEYKVFEKWITDEQIAVMLAMTSMKPSFVPLIAYKAKLPVKRTREILREITDIGLKETRKKITYTPLSLLVICSNKGIYQE